MDLKEICDLTKIAYQTELVRAATEISVKGMEAQLIATQINNPELIEDVAEISDYAKKMLLTETSWT